MTRSFTISVGTTPTLLVAPSWYNNPAVAPTSTVTAGSTITAAMLGTLVVYNSASTGTFSIPNGLTTDIGVCIWFGQMGAGVVNFGTATGVTIVGVPTTYGPNEVLQLQQTALNVWTASVYSWNLPQFLNRPPGGGLPKVAYSRISFINDSASPITVDTNPNVAVGVGTVVAANTIVNKDYGNGPAELWYGVAAAATPLSVWTGPLSYS
jgi:hypothetical protein